MRPVPTDARIERAAQSAARLVDALIDAPAGSGIDPRPMELQLTAAYSASHDTHRTDAAPERTYSPHVTYADRARAMGNASSDVAAYPVLDGAPVGRVESLVARRLETQARADECRARGIPTARQLRNMKRNARRTP